MGEEVRSVPAPAAPLGEAVSRFLAMTDAQTRADPYPLYDRLRIEAPVHHAGGGNWVVTRYAEVSSLLRADGHGWSRDAAVPGMLRAREAGEGELERQSAFVRYQSHMLLYRDPPVHTRLRSLVQRAFHSRNLESFRPHIRAMIDERLAALVPRGRMDLLHDFALPLPVQVITHILGLDVDVENLLARYTALVVKMLEPGKRTAEELAEADDLTLRFARHIDGLIEERRRRPRDDLLSALLAAEEEGQGLSRDEIVSMCIMLHVAGHETTGNVIANGIYTLLRHPGELQRLRRDPSLVESAVEEILRYESSARYCQARIAVEDKRLGGATIPEGNAVVAVVGAANRDPAVFDDPHRFDIGRTPNKHLAFGVGIHHCLGMALARLELQLAIAALITQLPDLALDTDEVVWRASFPIRALTSLPVCWTI